MDNKELRALSKEELERELARAREELRRLRFDVRQGSLTHVHRVRAARAAVARILTLRNAAKRTPSHA